MAGLLIVSGPPGAGKSTVAALLAGRFERSVLVPGDDFLGHLHRGGIDPWLPESSAQNEIVIQAAAAATGRYVSGGFDAVYDGVLGPWYLDRFAIATGLLELDYAVVFPDLETVLHRVATRIGHPFTDAEAATHLHGEFARADLDPRHLVAADGPPEQVADAIEAARATGRLRWTAT